MRISLFLLFVTLTCIACDSIVASSRGVIQAKTLDENSPREPTDRIRRRNLREGMVEADVATVEERVAFLPEGFNGLVSKMSKMSKMSKDKFDSLLKSIKRLFQSVINKFKKPPSKEESHATVKGQRESTAASTTSPAEVKGPSIPSAKSTAGYPFATYRKPTAYMPRSEML